MKSFLQRFGSLILGVLHGFDRLRFRGSKRLLCNPGGVYSFLAQGPVPLKDYKAYAKETTMALCRSIETRAKRAGLYHYLNNGHESKEQAASRLAAERGKQRGLIAVLGCVEPCQIVQVRGHRETGKLERRIEPGKCLHYYHYYLDADYGLRSARLQSWFPFTRHVGLNGRDWLARQMTAAGLAYRQKDNCFTWVEDWGAAQRLLDRQLTTDWGALLDGWAAEGQPWLARAGGGAGGAVLVVGPGGGICHRHRVPRPGGPAAALSTAGAVCDRAAAGRRCAPVPGLPGDQGGGAPSRSRWRGRDHDQGVGGGG